LQPHDLSFCAGQANPAPSARGGDRSGARLAKCVTGLMLGLAVGGCTRVLELPTPRMLSSASGPSIDVAPVTDERNTRKLGKLDTLMIESGPELASYLEAQLINGLGAAGLTPRQADASTPSTGIKRLGASLLSAELSSESTLLDPVVAAVRFRIELTDETGRVTFRKDFHGSTSRKLGFHTQGGPEDAELLVEAIGQATQDLTADRSFSAALFLAPTEEVGEGSDGANAASSEPPRQHNSGGHRALSPEERLSVLDQLLEEGLINQDDYTAKRKEILDDL
jgi:hypothetical protein